MARRPTKGLTDREAEILACLWETGEASVGEIRQSLTDADYEEVRNQGVSDEEMVEIIALAALGNYLDTIADSLKLPVDDFIAQALAS